MGLGTRELTDLLWLFVPGYRQRGKFVCVACNRLLWIHVGGMYNGVISQGNGRVECRLCVGCHDLFIM